MMWRLYWTVGKELECDDFPTVDDVDQAWHRAMQLNFHNIAIAKVMASGEEEPFLNHDLELKI